MLDSLVDTFAGLGRALPQGDLNAEMLVLLVTPFLYGSKTLASFIIIYEQVVLIADQYESYLVDVTRLVELLQPVVKSDDLFVELSDVLEAQNEHHSCNFPIINSYERPKDLLTR